jgi:glycosyltransferase involved in cell wall biosynthesis
MNILYISCHSTLEYDEVQLFTDLGHDVFSCGAYRQPQGHYDLPRPGIEGAVYHKDLDDIWVSNPNNNDLDPRLIEWSDVVIVMHSPFAIVQNWERLKHKKVVFRSIGQSVPGVERNLKPMREQGLKIVRYSPKEENILGYTGSDALIRFYKDPGTYKGWTGEKKEVVNFTQSLLGRRGFCHYEEIMPVISAYGGKVYGPGNEDLGEFNGGTVPYSRQIEILQESRAMVYGGTWPASYTLSFIEALMTGTPIVAISKALAHTQQYEHIDFYEVDELLSKIGGIVCDNIEDLVMQTHRLLEDEAHAKFISEKQRQLAIETFGKATISTQWERFFSDHIK